MTSAPRRKVTDRSARGYARAVTDQRVRPITTTVELCLRCGSTEPAVLLADCAHPRVARLVELRPELADLVTRLRRARSYLDHVARELAAAAELERLAGRALLDEAPDAFAPPAGVVFLRPRDERVRAPDAEEEEAAVPPPWPPVRLPPPERAEARPHRPKRRAEAADDQPELFQPPPRPPRSRQ